MEASRKASGSACAFLELPEEIQLACLGVAPDIASLCSALSSCSALHKLKGAAFKAVCYRNWPNVASVAADAVEGDLVPGAFWQRVVQTALVMDTASDATTDPVRSFNEHMVEQRRVLLVEWLIQVSLEFGLDGAAVFFAVRCMDAFFASEPPTGVKLLQLGGISCLGIAVQLLNQEQCLYFDVHPHPASAVASAVASAAPMKMAAVAAMASILPHRHEAPSTTECGPRSPTSAMSLPSWDPDLESEPGSEFKCGSNSISVSESSIDSDRDGNRSRDGGGVEGPAAAASAAPPSPGKRRYPTPCLRAATAAYLCADAYSVHEVEQMMAQVTEFMSRLGRTAPESYCTHRPMAAPTARHFLRYIWPAADAVAANAADASVRIAALHLAGFLLHMSLLCPTCCAAPPSHAAAAVVSLALEVLGLSPWPPALRRVLPLSLADDLGPLRARVAAAQAKYDVPYLRHKWMSLLAVACWPAGPGGSIAKGVRDGAGARVGVAAEVTEDFKRELREGSMRPGGGGGGDFSGAAHVIEAKTIRQLVEGIVQRKALLPLPPVA